MRLKNLLFVLIFSLCSLSHAAEEKEMTTIVSTPKTYSATVNPLGLLINQIGGKFSLKLTENIALTIPVVVYYSGYYSTNAFPISWGITAGVGAKFFIGTNVFETGWFVEPSMRFGFSQTLANVNSFFMAPGVIGGYGWVWDNGFTLNAGAGMVVAIQMFNTTVGAYPWPDFEVSLGYSW
jgi:hypothetical protein